MSEFNSNFQLAQKVEELTRSIDATIENARRRNRRGMVMSIVILVLLTCYLGYAHHRFTQVDPEMAGNFAQSVIQSYLPEAQNKLEKELIDNAPKAVDVLEQQVRAMPDTLASRMESQFSSEMDQHMPELENSIYTSVKTGLGQAKDHVASQPGKSDEDKFRAMLQELATIFGQESDKAIDEFHSKYTQGSTDLVAYIKLLSEDKQLNDEQKLHRQMLQNFLTLAYFHDSHPGQTDHTSVENIAGKSAAVPGTR